MFSLLLIPLVTIFAQTDSPNKSIEVPVYQKIKPLLKENTFLVMYINVDKIDLDGFITKLSPRIKQFSRTYEQKLSEFTKPKSPTPTPDPDPDPNPNSPTAPDSNSPPVADPNSPPVSETKPASTTDPAPTPAPATDPNSPAIPATENTSANKSKPELPVEANTTKTESGNPEGMFNEQMSLMFGDVGDTIRQAIGGVLADLHAGGIKEFYILSTLEIVQQCPAMLVVPGKLDLSPELKTKFESFGIHLLPAGLLGGCTLFAVDPQSVNQPTTPTNETNPDPNSPQPENPIDPNSPNPAPTTTPVSPPATGRTLPIGGGLLGNGLLGKSKNDTTNKYENIVKNFKKLKLKDRSEIKSGLHTQRNAPVQIVFAPSGGIKSMIKMMAPLAAGAAANAVPEAVKTVKESIDISLQLLEKLQSVSIGFIPENIRFNFAIEFLNEQDAQDAYALIEKVFKSAKNGIVDDIKKINSDLLPEQITRIADLNNKLFDNFMPKLRKHRILHSTTEKLIDNTIDIFAENLAQGATTGIALEQKRSAINKIKVIILALHNYQDANGKLPPLYTVNAEGKPLHSWRVLILPHLGETEVELHKKIKLDEPWDSEHNKQFHNAIIPMYVINPMLEKKGLDKTCSLVTIIDSPMKPKDGAAITEITDGTSVTVAIVELREPFCWMDPTADITVEEFSKPLDGKDVSIGGSQKDSVLVGFWDGNVKFIPNTTPPETLKAIATAKGEEEIKIP
ncbi:MAG: DUF1559 domain-containing protein [Planctomycetaceae bacterium]|nr:DUF1559 domain-containing protein [Planctomycetaceae bacterium]